MTGSAFYRFLMLLAQMGKLDSFGIELSKAEPAYRAGEDLLGKLMIVCSEVLHVQQLYIHVKGEGSTSWLNKTSEQAFTFNQAYLDRVVDIPMTETANQLSPGTHTVPFRLPLPIDIPSSVEGEWGFIRYKVRALIEVRPPTDQSGGLISSVFGLTSTGNDYSASVDFSVMAVVDLRRDPLNTRPVETEDWSPFFLCCCIRTGNIRASVRLQKLGFAVTEPIAISAQVNNQSGKCISNVTSKILQHIRFYGQSEFLQTDEIKEARILIGEKEWGSIPQRTRQVFEHEVIPIDPNRRIVPTQINYAVSVEYTILFEVEPTGPVLELPLILGTIPATVYATPHKSV